MYLDFVGELKTALDAVDGKEVDKAIQKLSNNRITLVMGNGGSFSLADHLVADLKKLSVPAIRIPSSEAELTMWANDEGYDNAYQRAIKPYGEIADGWEVPSPLVVVFSSSGESKNVLRAVRGWERIVFSGFDAKNSLNQGADIKIHVPSHDYGIVESAHDAIMHYIIRRLRNEL